LRPAEGLERRVARLGAGGAALGAARVARRSARGAPRAARRGWRRSPVLRAYLSPHEGFAAFSLLIVHVANEPQG